MKTRIITLAIVLPIIYFSLTNFIRSGSENKTVVTNSEVSDSFISLENSFSKISNAGNLEVPFSKTIKTAAVNDIQTDSKGTVWIATEAGITSINSDRTTVKNYNITEGTFPFSQAESIIFDNTNFNITGKLIIFNFNLSLKDNCFSVKYNINDII